MATKCVEIGVFGKYTVVVIFDFFRLCCFLRRGGVAKRKNELYNLTTLALPTTSHHEISTDIDGIDSNKYPNAYLICEIGRDLYFL